MNKLPLVAIFAAALAVGAYFVVGNTNQTSLGVSEALAQDTSNADTSLVQEMVLGAEDAPVTIIEYGSFTCPHCASFHAGVFPQIKENYIDTGKVRFINREVYFDRFGLWAGMIARCGGSTERYFGIVDMIYAQQSQWTSGENANDIVGNLRTLGKSAGLTDEMLDQCLSDADHATALVAVYEQTTKEHEVRGTPTFIVNGKKQSNMSYPEFASLIDKLLASDG